VAGILLGTAALAWPGITLIVLAFLFGAYLLLDGVFAAIAGGLGRSWLLLSEGVAGILTGVLALLWPAISAMVLLFLAAAWAIVTGVTELGASIRLRRFIRNEFLLVLSGLVSIAFGIMLVTNLRAGLPVLVWLTGGYALVSGALGLGLAIRLRRGERAAVVVVASRQHWKNRELRDRYRAFRSKRLDEVALLVLFLEAISLPIRPGVSKDVLVAWGYAEGGARVLLDVCLGHGDRSEDWLEMGRDLVRRRLRVPRLVVADETPGLTRAADRLWPRSDRQGCAVHRLHLVLAALSNRQDLRSRVRTGYWAALDHARSEAEAQSGLGTLSNALASDHPGAAAVLGKDLRALLVHLRYPLALRKQLRSTNLLDHSVAQAGRRSTLIDRFAGERSCRCLSWAVLDLVIAHTPWDRTSLEAWRLMESRSPAAVRDD
jgi:uncharacterized membrane protein HdeD (DUF308 family)